MTTVRRVQLGILAVVLVVFALAGVLIRSTVRQALVDRVDEQLTAGAEALASIDDLLALDQLDALAEIARQPDRASAILVFGNDGQLRLSVPSGVGADDDPLPDVGAAGADALRARPADPFTLQAVDGSIDYRTVTVATADGVVLIATPLDDLATTMGQVTLAVVVADVAAVVVIGAAIAFITRRAIEPIDDMIETAVAIGEGDLSRRIETVAGHPEVNRLNDALNEMLHQLEAAFGSRQASEEALRRFVADASHELRTPLTSIRGYAELYLSGAAADREGTDKAMQRIHAESLRTGALVEDLLLLARLDRSPELDSVPVDLAGVASDSVTDARAVEPGRHIELHVPDHPVMVAGDEHRLRQVVANLLANTRDHAPGSHVVVAVDDTDAAPVLSVADTGPGLSPEQAAHALERFWRADETRNRRTGGSGLGLSITAAIAASHQATVVIDTAPGRGLRISLRFPPSSSSN